MSAAISPGPTSSAFCNFAALVFGVGLMALIFYGSRKGYDEPAVLIKEPGVDPDDVQKTGQENIKTP